MLRGVPFCISLLLVLLLPIHARADVSAKLTEAQKAYDGRKDPNSLQKALDLWQEVLAEDPANAEAALNLSMAAVWWGDHSPKAKKEAIYKEGVDWGKLAVKADPKSSDAHYWTAANLGSYGQAHGILKSLSAIKPMKAHCEKAIGLNPKYWRARTLLGMLYREAPGWPISIGDDAKALEHLEKAAKMAPKVPWVLFELGLGYEETGDDAKAMAAYKRTVAAPLEQGFELEGVETKEKARKLIKKLSD